MGTTKLPNRTAAKQNKSKIYKTGLVRQRRRPAIARATPLERLGTTLSRRLGRSLTAHRRQWPHAARSHNRRHHCRFRRSRATAAAGRRTPITQRQSVGAHFRRLGRRRRRQRHTVDTHTLSVPHLHTCDRIFFFFFFNKYIAQSSLSAFIYLLCRQLLFVFLLLLLVHLFTLCTTIASLSRNRSLSHTLSWCNQLPVTFLALSYSVL